MKRKAPSADAMRKALATFKRKHPGKPVPGFLRKYAGASSTRANPVKRVQRKPSRLSSRARRELQTIRTKSRVQRKRVARAKSVRNSSMPFAVDVSNNGQVWRRATYSRTPDDAKMIARGLGALGYHARAVRTK